MFKVTLLTVMIIGFVIALPAAASESPNAASTEMSEPGEFTAGAERSVQRLDPRPAICAFFACHHQYSC